MNKLLVHTIAADWMNVFGSELNTVLGSSFPAVILAVKHSTRNDQGSDGRVQFPGQCSKLCTRCGLSKKCPALSKK